MPLPVGINDKDLLHAALPGVGGLHFSKAAGCPARPKWCNQIRVLVPRLLFASVFSSVKQGQNVPLTRLAVVIFNFPRGRGRGQKHAGAAAGGCETSRIIVALPRTMGTEASGRVISGQTQIC